MLNFMVCYRRCTVGFSPLSVSYLLLSVSGVGPHCGSGLRWLASLLRNLSCINFMMQTISNSCILSGPILISFQTSNAKYACSNYYFSSNDLIEISVAMIVHIIFENYSSLH